MKNRWIFVLAVVFFIAGCKYNEEVIPPAEDVQTIIQKYADQLATDRVAIQQTKAMAALANYHIISSNSFRIPLNFSIDNLSFYQAGLRKFEGEGDPGRFDFSGNLGIYQWDSVLEEFIRIDEDADFICINFPASATVQDNNASLKISRYEEAILTDGIIGVAFFNMELTIDGKPEMNLDYEASYDVLGNPVSLVMNLTVNPFQLSMDLEQSKGVMQINSSWKKEQNPILSSYFLVARNNLNFIPYDGLAFAGKTSGYIKYRELKLDGSFDFSATEIEKADKRAAVQMALYSGSRKLGRLYIDFSTEGERIIPGTIQYFIESMENNARIPADGLIRPLLDGFNQMI